MVQLDDLANWVDRVMTEETERFVAEVPYATHLTDEHELNEQYYLRHRVETVKRIRFTAKTDALSLARMVEEEYAAARLWSRYITEELGHDTLFLRDLREHGIPEHVVLSAPPFPSTVAMVCYIEEKIQELGSLAAVAYSLLVEWSSERFSPHAVAKAEKTFSTNHTKGSKSHLGIDEEEDHYRMMLKITSHLLERVGGLAVLENLLRTLSAYFRQYFTELYQATVPPKRFEEPYAASAPAIFRPKEREWGIERDLLPTEQDIAFYEAHGWYVSPPILPLDLLDEALEDCLRFFAGERDFPLPGDAPDWRQVPGLRFKMPYVSLQMRRVRDLVHLPILSVIASRLARTPTVRLFRDSLSYKAPQKKNERVGWHADRAYWPTCTSDNMLTAWIPFSDCNEENGTLVALDGSNHWPDNLERTLPEQDMENTLARLQTGGASPAEVPLQLRKGQVSFHHCRTVHASRENRSQEPRISLVVHLQDAANQYRSWQSNEGRPVAHLNDFLCRKLPTGMPDYTDPAVCPVLWSEGALLQTV